MGIVVAAELEAKIHAKKNVEKKGRAISYNNESELNIKKSLRMRLIVRQKTLFH